MQDVARRHGGTTRRAAGGGSEQRPTREENHDEAPEADDRECATGGGTMTDKIVAFVLYPGLTPLDLIGPLQVMTGLEVAERVYGIQPRHHVVVVAEHLDAVPTDTPVRVAATSTLDEFPEPDIVIVPGGGAPTLRQLVNPVLLDYLLCRRLRRRACAGGDGQGRRQCRGGRLGVHRIAAAGGRRPAARAPRHHALGLSPLPQPARRGI